MRPGLDVSLAWAGRDSGSRNMAAMKFASERPAANQAGAAYPQWLRNPPIAGPKMNPRPNAAPMSPMPFARVSGVVVSAMNACAVETLAPAMPARVRARNSVGSDAAKAKNA